MGRTVGKRRKARSRDGLFVRVQTFNIGDDESSEEVFKNPVCLQGWVTPPCFGKVKGRQKCLFSNEQMFVWCL